MINISITFFVLALVAYFIGANGIAGTSLEIGKMFLVLFLILSVISFIASLIRGKKGPRH